MPRDLQPLEAAFAGRAQVLWPAVGQPVARTGPDHAALGRDDQSARIGIEAAGDQLLAHVGPVGVGGVDEIHTELDRAAQHPLCLGRILRWAPDAGAGDAHGAKAHAIHRQIATDADGARSGGGCRSGGRCRRGRGRREETRHACDSCHAAENRLPARQLCSSVHARILGRRAREHHAAPGTLVVCIAREPVASSR